MWAFSSWCFSCAFMGMCWTMFDHSYQVWQKRKQGLQTKGSEKPKELTPSHLWILINTYLSYRPRPLILIGTLKVDERTAHTNTHPFIIQSVAELSTWINKSPPYLTNAKLDKRSHRVWMEEAVSTSILVCLCLIQRQNPVFLSNPSSWFFNPQRVVSLHVRETYASPPHHPYMIPLSCLSSGRWAYIFQRLINPQHCRNFPG